MDYIKELEYALAFTQEYKAHQEKGLREAKCLKLQINHVLQPILNEDLIVGFMRHGLVGFSPQYGGIYTYFFHKDQTLKALEASRGQLDQSVINAIDEMIIFFEKEATFNRLNHRFKDTYGFVFSRSYHEPGLANAGARVAGNNVDLDKLIRLGVPGLLKEIEDRKHNSFYDALKLSVELICEACDIYINDAKIQLKAAASNKRKAELQTIIQTLEHNKTRAPKSFREGLQLFWIYAVISDLMNYGRMDVYLGDLYCRDIDSGSLTEEEAIDLISSLWRQFVRIGKVHDCRVIVGGKGRRNPENAYRLAFVFMEVSIRLKEFVPQLTLRYHSGIDEALMDKALSVLSEGYCFPIIYSDDTNIPAVMKAYAISEEEAAHYLPFGCGEYVLEGLSTGTPNNGVNLLKALELVLHDGYDPYWNLQLETSFGGIEKLDSFEKLFNQYTQYIDRNVHFLALQKKMNYDIAGEQADYLHLSLLTEDCIKRGKGLLEGGVRYLNASSEIYGMISCADSLTAIKKLVYEEKRFTLNEVVNMLDSNFEGYEKERKLFLSAPKYGNDNAYADDMAKRVFTHIAEATIKAGEKAGLNKYLMTSVNNSMSAEWGEYCMASACGRKRGEAMANGNGASLGADQSGLTALLNSMAKFDNTKHVGVINNIRVTKEMMLRSYDKLKTLLKVFFNHNGVQLNITCIGKDDLIKAMAEPEKYSNLIVRIGGFSARFVELSPVVQMEILRRTTYEA